MSLSVYTGELIVSAYAYKRTRGTCGFDFSQNIILPCRTWKIRNPVVQAAEQDF